MRKRSRIPITMVELIVLWVIVVVLCGLMFGVYRDIL